MSKRMWILITGVAALMGAAAVGVAVVLVIVPMYRSQDHLERAKAAVAAGNDGVAKRFYREYLYLNQDDGEVLEAYAELCLAQLDNRRQNLTEAGRAY